MPDEVPHERTVSDDRIRSLVAERLQLVFLAPAHDHEALARERLTEVDHQVPMLIDRHRRVHHAILPGNTACVLLAAAFVAIEVRSSHRSVAYEAMRVVGLEVSWSQNPPGPGYRSADD